MTTILSGSPNLLNVWHDRLVSSGSDAAAMSLALELARVAPTHGDVPVGAIVMDADGRVVGRGHNVRERDADPMGHAEMVALAEAAASVGSWRLDGCTLVVTLEPCTMCAGALVGARIARLVFGAWDDKAGAVGSLWDVVRDRRLNHRPEVTAGVLAEESATLLREFFRRPPPPAMTASGAKSG